MCMRYARLVRQRKKVCIRAYIVRDIADVVVVVVENWHLGPLEKGFPSKRYQLVVISESGGDGSQNC